MSIFKRQDPQQAASPPGVVPPPAAPTYQARPPQRVEGNVGALAEKVRQIRGTQENVQERVRIAVKGTRTTTGVAEPCGRAQPAPNPRTGFPTNDPTACAQVGLLSLARRWADADSPIRAIHAYVELLTRYPGTPAAREGVVDLVQLSERLANDGQFHTALAIYDHLEQLL